jgi:hypothetical protein
VDIWGFVADGVADYQQQVKKLVMQKFNEEEMEAVGKGQGSKVDSAPVRQISATA